jgi:hypothetical protein
MSLVVSYDNGDAINRLPLAGAADLLPANHESAEPALLRPQVEPATFGS